MSRPGGYRDRTPTSSRPSRLPERARYNRPRRCRRWFPSRRRTGEGPVSAWPLRTCRSFRRRRRSLGRAMAPSRSPASAQAMRERARDVSTSTGQATGANDLRQHSMVPAEAPGWPASDHSRNACNSPERPASPAHPAAYGFERHCAEGPRVRARGQVVSREPDPAMEIDVVDPLHQQPLGVPRVARKDNMPGLRAVVSVRSTVGDKPVTGDERRQHALAFDAAAEEPPAKPEDEASRLDGDRDDGRRPEHRGSPVTPPPRAHATLRQLAR
jgi:hypothetical protein